MNIRIENEKERHSLVRPIHTHTHTDTFCMSNDFREQIESNNEKGTNSRSTSLYVRTRGEEKTTNYDIQYTTG